MRNLFFIGLLILFYCLAVLIIPFSYICSTYHYRSESSMRCSGETIIITGTSFGDTQGSSVVTFNGGPATVNSWSNTQIEVLVPNAAITGNVVVTVNGINSNGIWFTIPCYTHVVQVI